MKPSKSAPALESNGSININYFCSHKAVLGGYRPYFFLCMDGPCCTGFLMLRIRADTFLVISPF